MPMVCSSVPGCIYILFFLVRTCFKVSDVSYFTHFIQNKAAPGQEFTAGHAGYGEQVSTGQRPGFSNG